MVLATHGRTDGMRGRSVVPRVARGAPVGPALSRWPALALRSSLTGPPSLARPPSAITAVLAVAPSASFAGAMPLAGLVALDGKTHLAAGLASPARHKVQLQHRVAVCERLFITTLGLL